MSNRTATLRTFSFLLLTIVIYLLLWQAISARVVLPVYYYGRLIELLGLLLFVALAIGTPMRFEDMGIVTDKATLLRSLRQGALLTGALLVLLILLSRISDADTLFFRPVRGDISRTTYILVAPLQEVLAKSVMHYSFELCLGRSHPVWVILLCAVCFGIFHVVYGLQMMLLAMALSCITGVCFHRCRCVWGCALTHFSFGFLPALFGL